MDWTRDHGPEEDRWAGAAFRWVLGLGALLGAWWALCALLALQGLVAGRWELAAPAVVFGLAPHALWRAATAARDDRATVWLGRLEAAWRAGWGRRVPRRALLAAVACGAVWAAAA